MARAKVGGHGCSLRGSRKVAPSPACPLAHFKQGNTMVFLRTCLSHLTKIKGLVNLRSFELGITMVFCTSACGMLESLRIYKGFVNYSSRPIALAIRVLVGF